VIERIARVEKLMAHDTNNKISNFLKRKHARLEKTPSAKAQARRVKILNETFNIN
jgi:hypothetical protein